MFRNKGKRKKITALVVAALLLSLALPVYVYADDPTAVNVIYEERTTQTITQGVTLENLVRFTKDGWYDFQIVKVDMSNEHIDINTLSDAESFTKRASTKKMAEQSGAVAAVNGSFFTPAGTGVGFTTGAIMGNSELLCASDNINRYSDSMASLSITNKNKAILDFWKVDMDLTTPSGKSVPFQHYNKPDLKGYTEIYVYDKKWGDTAVGATSEMPDLFQMVVEDGIVTAVITGEPAQKIPDNGFVAVTRSEGANKLKRLFTVGSEISMNIKSTPDWKDIKMSVSGSAILVENGVVPSKFSFEASDIMKKSPKTALGFSKDNKTMYLVTVDGRQTASIGLTLRDMALFMQSIGAHNAVNMDGGGSTTMVARPEGEKNVKVINNPSDGVTRAVINAVGVFTSAPESPLAGLIIETTDRYMFANTTRAFTLKGLDKYNNPVDVDQSEVEWSISGVEGEFDGNVLKALTNGEGVVSASIGDITASKSISVLSKPAAITLNTSSIKVPAGSVRPFTIVGVNPKGYTASIDPSDLDWKLSSEIGSFENGVFKAEKRGVGYIDASLGDVHAYCSVSVSEDIPTVVERFEEFKGTFQSYPIMTEGYYYISGDEKISGKTSGKMEYNFATNTDVTRAAYLALPEKGFTLDPGVSRIGLHVHNDHANSSWLRAEIVDANGKSQVVDLAKPMDWEGWKYVDASVANISKPARLSRIYIAQVNPEPDEGCLYFDDLTFVKSGYPSTANLEIPEDTKFADESNIAVSFKKATDDSFRFGVMGQSYQPKTDVENNLINIFANKIDKYLEVGAVVGSGSHESLTGKVNKKPVIATHTTDLKDTKDIDYKYSVTDFNNSRFIKLDTRQKGLRLSDPDQWNRFLNDLESYEGQNVFIFMESDPNNFADKLELKLFKETLKNYRYDTLKNVCVFYNGQNNECTLEEGVRYFETAGYAVNDLKANDTKNAQYVLVTVKGASVTYVYKPIDS